MQGGASIRTVTIGIAVDGLPAAESWYRHVLGERPEVRPVAHVLEFELTPGCWLQLIKSAAVTPGTTTFRIGVADLRAEHRRLLSAGIDAGPIETLEGILIRCALTDPSGNALSLYELV